MQTQNIKLAAASVPNNAPLQPIPAFINPNLSQSANTAVTASPTPEDSLPTATPQAQDQLPQVLDNSQSTVAVALPNNKSVEFPKIYLILGLLVLAVILTLFLYEKKRRREKKKTDQESQLTSSK